MGNGDELSSIPEVRRTKSFLNSELLVSAVHWAHWLHIKAQSQLIFFFASASTDDGSRCCGGGLRGRQRRRRVHAEAAAPRGAPRLHLHAAQGQAVRQEDAASATRSTSWLVGSFGTKYMLQIKLIHGNLISSTSTCIDNPPSACMHATIYLACNFCSHCLASSVIHHLGLVYACVSHLVCTSSLSDTCMHGNRRFLQVFLLGVPSLSRSV